MNVLAPRLHFPFLAICFVALITNASAQFTLTIHQIGRPTDSLFVADYPDNQQPKRLNDSTLVFTSNAAPPERIAISIDRRTKWWTNIWIEKANTKKEIDIYYETKEVGLINGTEWDAATLDWMDLFNRNDLIRADSIAISYVQNHPASYLSLFMISHGTYRENPAKKKAALEMLDPKLKDHPKYKQTMAMITSRKIPKKGQSIKEFSLVNINDSVFHSQSIRNKWIILHFRANNCTTCIRQFDELNDLYRDLDPKKAILISVSLDDSKQQWKENKFSKRIRWTNLWSDDNTACTLCLEYNLLSIPHYVVFDKDKKLYFVKEGPNALPEVRSILTEKNLLK
jgi:peroxiredoxin